MPDRYSLRSYYDYWDDFVSRWLNGEIKDCDYLPEPWWGWTPESELPLRSVVINLNPGRGGNPQTRTNVRAKLGDFAYSEAMAKGLLSRYLRDTDKWHLCYRARPIASRLPDFRRPLSESLSSHLSIELSPLHTEKSDSVEGYVAAHFDKVVCNTLKFAASASRLIEGPLNGIVIVRCGAQRFLRMFGSLGSRPCCQDQNPLKSPYWFTISKPEFEGVKFVCVWGARNFLPKKDLAEIIKNQNV